MEAKVKALRIALIITILFIPITFLSILIKNNDLKQVMISINAGIVGGGILACIIYATEYRVIRQKILEEYWQRVFDLNQLIMSIRPICIEEDFEPIINKIKNTKDVDKWEIGNLERELQSVLTDYINVERYDFNLIEKAYGDIYFFFGNGKRKNIYKSIHEPLRKMYRSISINTKIHFQPYHEHEHNNFIPIVEIIKKVQREIFIEKVIDENCEERTEKIGFENRFYFSMDDEIESFRAKVIYNEIPEYRERFYTIIKIRTRV